MQSSTFSRQATDRDFTAILDTLTVSFANDPVWGGWAFPDRGRSSAQRRAIFGFWLSSALRLGAVRVTQRCEAVAMWIPPGQVETTKENEPHLIAMTRELLGDHAGAFLKGGELFEAAHPRERPHYYLSLLGTHDDHRGKGIGMALLRDNLAAMDASGIPAYLESTNPVNVARYERIGFAKVGGFILPAGGPRVDTMWREPGGGSI